jgi:hypothetical protein
MKTFLVATLLAAFAIVLGGCGDSHATHVHPDTTPAATYKAGHGVRLTEPARKFAGLVTGEVMSHTFKGVGETTSVPAEALLRTARGDFVYVTNGDWFLRTPVVTGATDGAHVEIKDGLYEGDSIVVQGARALALSEIQALNGGVGCADGH